MKKIMMLMAGIVIGMNLMAAPLRNVNVTLTQPDGQVIHCFASGDEYYNYLHDANGFTIVQGEGGYYVYAVKDAVGKVVPSSYRVNSVDPAMVGLEPYVKISAKEYYARRQQWQSHIEPPQAKNGRELNHGLYNNLVVFIRFAGDTYHHSSFSTVKTMFNGAGYEDNSLHNFYHHTSYNQLDLWSHFFPEPDGETILSYEDIHPKQYYQPYDPVTNPIGYQDGETAEREFSMLERAINYIEDMVPLDIDLDYNNDGKVDNVVFVIKGEPGEWASLLWPHRWCIYDRYVPLHDLRVYDFNLQLEQGGYFNVSTLCHEMCHSLGAPDLYHYSGGIDPVGGWDLMCGTSEPPQQTDVYMKYKYGNWVDNIPDITGQYGTYELESVTWEGNRRNGFKIQTGNPNQFLFLEYRDKTQLFDRTVPGGGLLIYRIDTRYDGNAGWNGYDSFDEVYLFRPGGNINNGGDLNLANFCAEAGRVEFSQYTDPHIFYTNGQTPDWQECIYDISEKGDRIRFTYGPLDHTPAPTGFVANVNAEIQAVTLSWESAANAESYNVLRDGEIIALHYEDTVFVDGYDADDLGYHVYQVCSVYGGMDYLQSDMAEEEVILGPYETLRISISSESPYGTQGGELELTFDQPLMKARQLTIYRGGTAEADVHVPAGTVVNFLWHPGFDEEGTGIHVSAMHLNDQGQGTLFDFDGPTEGPIATYMVADNGLGCFPAQHVTATTEGSNIRLRWSTHTENNRFNIYRNSVLVASEVSGYEYLDDKILRSGAHHYQVETCCGDYFSWNPDQAVIASAMCYHCEPPRNLQGTHQPGINTLQWEEPQFVGHGLLAYDDNLFVDAIETAGRKAAARFNPELLAAFGGSPLTHLEVFDCAPCSYRFQIYNGEATNNSTLLMTQQQEMEGTGEMVRIPLETPVSYDPTLPLWIVLTPLSGAPVACCQFVGENNSALLSAGANWRPLAFLDIDYSWILRAYTAPTDGNRDFTYNLYWGPEEGGVELLELGMTNLGTTSAVHNTDENTRYHVTAIWNDRETELSNPVYLGPSVDVEETASESSTVQVFPNPVREQLTIQGKGLQRLTLYTLTGLLVEDRPAEGDRSTLIMEALPKGMYLLGVHSEEGYRVVKVVKD